MATHWHRIGVPILLVIAVFAMAVMEGAADNRPQPALVLKAATESVDVSTGLEYLVETGGPLSPEIVAAGDSTISWRPVARTPLNFGKIDSALWLRFRADFISADHKEWLLQIDWPFLDRVEMYVLDRRQGRWLYRTSADGWRLPEGVPDHFPFVFELNSNGRSSVDVFLRVHSPAKMILPLKVWRADAFRRMTQHRNIMLGLFFGALAVMCCYNGFLFPFTRDGSYAYYAVYVLPIMAYTASMTGLGVAHLWGANRWINIHAFVGQAPIKL